MGIDIAGIGSVADLAGSIIGKIWPDKTQTEKDQMAQAMALLQAQVSMNTGQMEINKVEASNPSLFASGWRPALGWICGSACAWNWVGLPVVTFGCSAFGVTVDVKPADLTQMLPILMGMLGLGAYRTYEKTQGVARS